MLTGLTADFLPALATALAIAGSAYVVWRVHTERSLRLRTTAKAEMGPGHVGPRVVHQPLRVVIETPIADAPEVRGLYRNATAPLPAATEIRGLTPFFVDTEDEGKSSIFDAGVVANKDVYAAAMRQRKRVVEAFHKYGFIVVRQGVAQAQAEAAREELEGVILANNPDIESIYFEGGIRQALQTGDTTPGTPIMQQLGSDTDTAGDPSVGDDGALGTTLSDSATFCLGELPAELRRAFVRKVMGYSHAGHPRLQLLTSTCRTVAEALCASPMKLMQDMVSVSRILLPLCGVPLSRLARGYFRSHVPALAFPIVTRPFRKMLWLFIPIAVQHSTPFACMEPASCASSNTDRSCLFILQIPVARRPW